MRERKEREGRCLQKKKKLTFLAQRIGISRFTTPFAVSSLFVTRRGIQTVTTAIVDAIIAIGAIVANCSNERIEEYYFDGKSVLL